MPTKRLHLTTRPAVIHLEPTGPNPVEIEVPAGESEYRILHGTESDHAEFIFHLRHAASKAVISGRVEAAGESTPRLRTAVIHHAPNTQAETLVKTLSQDAAYPHYEGVIIIEEGANGAESYLTHHSLLLGTTAKSWTLPSLEIKADGVKCSHAATSRTITELDLFYLRSRGLEASDARQTLVEAFLKE